MEISKNTSQSFVVEVKSQEFDRGSVNARSHSGNGTNDSTEVFRV